MSLATFKKKSIIQNHGTKVSGKPPGGIWLSQGPFGKKALSLTFNAAGPEGFSLNGGHRNVGYVGKSYAMSSNGTPMRGQYPYGSGGIRGRYAQPEPVYNVNRVYVLGTQADYIKQSVLSTKGMLEKKYKWAYTGQYPNYWVQPNYTGNQTDSASQGAYLQSLSAANTCVIDVNKSYKYEDNIKRGGPTLCKKTTAKFKFNDMASNAPYTKFTNNSQDSSTYTLQIQKKCQNPTGAQKPFPYATSGGRGIQSGGTGNVSVGNSCGTTFPYYTSPPEWYINSPSEFGTPAHHKNISAADMIKKLSLQQNNGINNNSNYVSLRTLGNKNKNHSHHNIFSNIDASLLSNQ